MKLFPYLFVFFKGYFVQFKKVLEAEKFVIINLKRFHLQIKQQIHIIDIKAISKNQCLCAKSALLTISEHKEIFWAPSKIYVVYITVKLDIL